MNELSGNVDIVYNGGLGTGYLRRERMAGSSMTLHLITQTCAVGRGAVVLLAGHATTSSAQSLADVARREAERRQQVPSGKVYTDGDLAPVDAATPPPQPPSQQSPASGGETPDTQPPSSQAPPGDNPGKEPGHRARGVRNATSNTGEN